MLRTPFLTLILIFSAPTMAANDILVTKFSGQIGKVSTMGIYSLEPKGYFLKERKYGVNEMLFTCKNTMESLDIFKGQKIDLFMAEQLKAFDRYLQTGYLSREEVAEYLGNSVQFQNRQITFLHSLSENLSVGELKGIAPDLNLIMSGDGLKPRSVESSLYIVPGQSIEFDPLKGVNAKEQTLPWTLDPEFKEIARLKFDRNRYPLTWEIGRAAGSGSRDFIHLLSFTGRDILNQILHMGFPNPEHIKSSYVTFHALNEENKGKFNKLFPNAEILESPKNAHNVVFIIPVTQFLERFPPERTIFETKILKELFPELKPEKIQSILALLKYAKFKTLDFQYKDKFQQSPVFVSMAHSEFWMADIHKILQAYTPESLKNPNHLQTLLNTLSNKIFVESEKPWKNITFEPTSIHLLQKQKKAHSAIQITNFNPKLIESDPMYIIAVVSAAYDDFIRTQLGNQPGTPENVRLITEGIIRNGFEFVLTTHHASTARAIQNLKPTSYFIMETNQDSPTRDFWSELRTQHHEFAMPNDHQFRGFYFTTPQIFQIRAFYDQYTKSSKSNPAIGISLGYFWSLSNTSSP